MRLPLALLVMMERAGGRVVERAGEVEVQLPARPGVLAGHTHPRVRAAKIKRIRRQLRRLEREGRLDEETLGRVLSGMVRHG